jgi:hypothetical protein
MLFASILEVMALPADLIPYPIFVMLMVLGFVGIMIAGKLSQLQRLNDT